MSIVHQQNEQLPMLMPAQSCAYTKHDGSKRPHVAETQSNSWVLLIKHCKCLFRVDRVLLQELEECVPDAAVCASQAEASPCTVAASGGAPARNGCAKNSSNDMR